MNLPASGLPWNPGKTTEPFPGTGKKINYRTAIGLMKINDEVSFCKKMNFTKASRDYNAGLPPPQYQHAGNSKNLRYENPCLGA